MVCTILFMGDCLRLNLWFLFRTGSDTQNANQAGSGIDRTDRSNILLLKEFGYNMPMAFSDIATQGIITPEEAAHLARAGQHANMCNNEAETGCCFTRAQLEAKHGANNNGNIDQDPQNCMMLNAGSAYFDAGLIQMNKVGVMNYMSSRNNNFSNRIQKGVIIVAPPATSDALPAVRASLIAVLVVVMSVCLLI